MCDVVGGVRVGDTRAHKATQAGVQLPPELIRCALVRGGLRARFYWHPHLIPTCIAAAVGLVWRIAAGSLRLRRAALQLKADAGWRRGRYSGPRVNESRKDRQRETEFAQQGEIAYRRLIQDWQPQARRKGAGATQGRASSKTV